MTSRRQVLAVVSILAGAVLAGCGSSASSTSDAVAPLAGATSAPGIAVASMPMGELASPQSTFWELFARVGRAWSLLTPPGAATNGGVVGTVVAPTSVTAAVVPSANLRFSPVAETTNHGASWSTGVLPGGLVASADALSASPSGRRAALLASGGGSVAVSASGLSAWSTLADSTRIATATSASGCRLGTLRAVAFGPGDSVVVGGQCAHGSRAPIAVWRRGTWQVGSPIGIGVDDAVLGLSGISGGVATILETHWRGGRAVVAARSPDGLGPWTRTSHLVLARGARVTSTSLSFDGSTLVVVRSPAGGLAAYAADTSGGGWRLLPALPRNVVDVVAGPGRGYQALAVDGATLAVLDPWARGWRVAQRLVVPLPVVSSR